MNLKKIGFLLVSISFLNLFGLSHATEGSLTDDFLEQVYSPAIQSDTVIGGKAIGTTKKSVGNYVMKGGTDIDIITTINEGVDKGITKRQSLIISVTKFILRMTVVLSVTMIIYNGIMYVIKSSKGENAKDVLKNLLYIGIGLLIALLSVVIIRLVSSIGASSLSTIV